MGPLTRSAIVAEARRWVGTPYVHQASVHGAGCDCLGLVRGVWRALIGPEPQTVPAYSPDWAERSARDTLREAANAWLVSRPIESAACGDVLLFRMSADAPTKHCAILTAPDRIIHAYWARAVVESRYAPWWQTRCVGAYTFPGVV
jgi:NlpC/P60 family putative phage cell wall peptidase